jgi:hypothetical protein
MSGLFSEIDIFLHKFLKNIRCLFSIFQRYLTICDSLVLDKLSKLLFLEVYKTKLDETKSI